MNTKSSSSVAPAGPGCVPPPSVFARHNSHSSHHSHLWSLELGTYDHHWRFSIGNLGNGQVKEFQEFAEAGNRKPLIVSMHTGRFALTHYAADAVTLHTFCPQLRRIRGASEHDGEGDRFREDRFLRPFE